MTFSSEQNCLSGSAGKNDENAENLIIFLIKTGNVQKGNSLKFPYLNYSNYESSLWFDEKQMKNWHLI